MPAFVLCHDQRAYPWACLLHISLNELLDAREAREETGGKMDVEWKRRTETRERKRIHDGAERPKPNCTDYTICLHDVL